MRHGLEVVDGYGKRFQRLRAAQTGHSKAHRTTEFEFYDPCCTEQGASPPRRVPDQELRDARRTLCDAAYRFLLRCYHDRQIDERQLREACGTLGIGIDAADLEAKKS